MSRLEVKCKRVQEHFLTPGRSGHVAVDMKFNSNNSKLFFNCFQGLRKQGEETVFGLDEIQRNCGYAHYKEYDVRGSAAHRE